MTAVQVWLGIIGGFGILSFASSLINIYVTTKGLRASKYIDTITNSRIKWIEKISNEAAELHSMLMLTIMKEAHILQLKTAHDNTNDIDKMIESLHLSVSKSRRVEGLKKEIENISKNDILLKINLIKLRINPQDNSGVLDVLDTLTEFAIDQDYTTDKINNYWLVNQMLIKKVQYLLKAEWEKTKSEAKAIKYTKS